MIKSPKTSGILIALASLFLLASATTASAQFTGQDDREYPPTFSDKRKTLPPIKAAEGRIFFFREPMSGGIFSPTLKMNGKPLSKMSSGEVFYVDRPPGSYKVSVETEVERSASFTLNPGETKYIKVAPAMGVMVARFELELMDEKQALYEMGPLELGKPKPPE